MTPRHLYKQSRKKGNGGNCYIDKQLFYIGFSGWISKISALAVFVKIVINRLRQLGRDSVHSLQIRQIGPRHGLG